MTVLKILLIAAGAIYLGLMLLLYLLQDRFLYFPTREVRVTPAQRGLRHDDITIRTDDGVTLAAWWVPAPRARGTVLFLHGNGGNLGHVVEAVETYARLGLDVLAIDYRGYGASEGAPSADGIMRDARAAWRYLVEERGVAPSRIILVGRSLGGGPASALAAQHAASGVPAGLVLESTYTSIPDRAAELFPIFPVRWILRTRFDTRANLAGVRCPVLVVHSTDDETIPYHHGRALYEAASAPKELVTLAHGHNDGFARSAEVYVAALERFVARVLGGDGE